MFVHTVVVNHDGNNDRSFERSSLGHFPLVRLDGVSIGQVLGVESRHNATMVVLTDFTIVEKTTRQREEVLFC